MGNFHIVSWIRATETVLSKVSSVELSIMCNPKHVNYKKEYYWNSVWFPFCLFTESKKYLKRLPNQHNMEMDHQRRYYQFHWVAWLVHTTWGLGVTRHMNWLHTRVQKKCRKGMFFSHTASSMFSLIKGCSFNSPLHFTGTMLETLIQDATLGYLSQHHNNSNTSFKVIFCKSNTI